jgi:GTPase SAR1 family protein
LRGIGLLALINVKTREVQIKIVYYGPGRGGKTTYCQSAATFSLGL